MLDFATLAGRRNWLILIAVLAGVVWSPLFGHQFLMWDDDFNLYQNQLLVNGKIAEFWRQPYMGFYIPLTYSVWTLLGQIFSLNSPLPFEILNFSFHIVNSLLVYFYLVVLVEQVTAPSDLNPEPGAKGRKHREEAESKFALRRSKIEWAAFLGALVYLFHPYQTSAVAWHSGFRDLLSHFWTLLSLNLLLRHQSGRAIALGLGLFFLSLLSKPSSVAMPVIVLLLTLLLPGVRRKPMFVFCSITLLVGLYFSLWTRQIQSQFMVGIEEAEIIQRPVIMADAYGFYLRQFFGFFPQSADYGRTPPRVMEWGLWRMTIPWLAGFLVILPLLFWKKWRELTVFLILWAIPLGPVSGIVTFNYQRISTVADHYFIPALPAFCFVVALFSYRPPRWARNGLLNFLILPLILFWAFKTYERIPDWSDNKAFFKSILRANPYSHSANNYLGFFAFQERDYVVAEGYFRQAAASLPQSAISSGNLAYALLRQGRNAEAAQYLAPKLQDPDFFEKNMVHRHVIAVNFIAYGLALANTGRYREGFDSLCQAFRYDPQPGDRRDALESMEKLKRQLNPQNPAAVKCENLK